MEWKCPQHAFSAYLDTSALGAWGADREQSERVMPYLGPLAGWMETLKRPKRVLIVEVPIERDDGTVAHLKCYRLQHKFSRGPRGGVRFHQNVSLPEVMTLAAWMTIENATINVPLSTAAFIVGCARCCRRGKYAGCTLERPIGVIKAAMEQLPEQLNEQ
jgi:glutamate dehydrogenase (NAD(P)+)